MNKKFTGFLDKELTALVREEVIDCSSAERIRNYYDIKSAKNKRILVIFIFGLIGTLFLGAGTLLLIAYNWSGLSRMLRTLISLAPLIISQFLNGYTILYKKDSLTWKESSALGWIISLALSFALISQTFHIPGNFERFLFSWLILIVPVIYFQQSYTAATAYMAGLTWWLIYAVDSGAGMTVFSFWTLYALLLFLIYRIIKNKKSHILQTIFIMSSLAALITGIALTMDYGIKGLWIVVFSSLFCTVFLSGKIFYNKLPLSISRLCSVMGGLGLSGISLFLTFKSSWRYIFQQSTISTYYISRNNGTIVALDIFLALILTAGAAYMLYSAIRKGPFYSYSFGVMIIPVIICFFLAMINVDFMIPAIIFNLLLFTIGINRLLAGIKHTDAIYLNTGLGITFLIIIIRFLDLEMSLSAKGFSFIFAGICFLSANYISGKKKKSSYE
ncbi:MAG: DUF2157 domain-containing protein [bacterium]|nr:DUF2157 domain-containing protein [bacterium]